MNGQLILDIRGAQAALDTGLTESQMPGVEAWIDYATCAGWETPMKHILATGCHRSFVVVMWSRWGRGHTATGEWLGFRHVFAHRGA